MRMNKVLMQCNENDYQIPENYFLGITISRYAIRLIKIQKKSDKCGKLVLEA